MSKTVLREYIDEPRNILIKEYTDDGTTISEKEYVNLNEQTVSPQTPSTEERISLLEQAMNDMLLGGV